MATNTTLATLDDILSIAKPQPRLVCAVLRSKIVSLHSDVVELAWPKLKIISFGIGPRKMTEHYVYISVHDAHVNLGFYHGTSLADPHGIMQGTGKTLRHVKVRDVSTINSAPVIELLQLAIADRKWHANRA
ncbi:hypothetical protein FHY18_004039 [Xanthomonas arboricola]|uniref:DUF1801 domain-containing protein n=1 Tax=Xanthomonas sp. 3793 TaxID=3035312 RepID=UPI0021676662|nr:DUF1801 domain-containing protein [Xanthomonas sp. 3793]MCS3748402.1 hypothetical protein [Xanthomonas sp. 3793]